MKGNCVIVGRGAKCVLHNHDEVFHVFIYAPWAERVERVRARAQSGRDVEELIRGTDHERASYLRTHYGCDWRDPHLYQLMINVQIGAGMAARMIVNAVQEGCYGAAPEIRQVPMFGTRLGMCGLAENSAESLKSRGSPARGGECD